MMEKMLLHLKIVRWVESFLAERSTMLTFDDYTSDCVPVPTGVLQGSPLSVILYLIYSPGLLEVSSMVLENKDKILGFIEDMAMIVVSKTIEENLGKLQKLGLDRLEWAQESESKFDMDKYQLVHHTRCSDPPQAQSLPLRLAGKMIKPKESAKYLGIHIDKKLNFKSHIEYTVGRGVAASITLTRLSSSATGMPHKFIRRLFVGLVVPRMDYGLGVWYNPVREGEHRTKGSVGFATKLARPQ